MAIILAHFSLFLHPLHALATCIPQEQYGVQREVWTNIYGGWYLKHLIEDAQYPDNPSLKEKLATFDVPQNYSSLYGQRLRAFFVPPVDGNYTFLATCDSECNFYISRDHDPQNKEILINRDQDHRTSYSQWDKYPPQRSCIQTLERQKLYYMELLHSNYISSDHARIHVIYPESAQHRPIESHHLIQYRSATECAALKKCGLTCGGGFFTRIKVRKTTAAVSCLVPYNISGEKAPDEPPENVSAQAVSSTSIHVQWQTVPKNHRNGIIRGYRIIYSFERDTEPRRNQDGTKTEPRRNQDGTKTEPRRNQDGTKTEPRRKRSVDEQPWKTYSTVLHDAEKMETTLQGLVKYTRHCIRLLAYTSKGDGPPSPCVYSTTIEDVPSRPPPSFKVTTLDTSSISVTWEPLLHSHVNGILIGYRLSYKLTGTPEQSIVINNASSIHKVLDKLRHSSEYCVQLFAFTRVGEGPGTGCHMVWTKSPDMLPLKVIAKTRISATGIKITWRPLPRGAAPDLSHYSISYRAIKMSGQDVFNSTVSVKNVSHDVNEVILENLTYYATYKIELKSVNSSGGELGQKILYADTCQCDLQSMSTSIKLSPPYIYKAADNSTRGLLVELLEQMMQKACGQCIMYDNMDRTYTSDMLLQEKPQEEADFTLPILLGAKVKDMPRYIPLINVPGVALVTIPKSAEEYAGAVTKAVFTCWPCFAIGIMLAFLAGIIMWFLEQSSGSEQFKQPFHKGMQDGIWWAFVTMTTVGYGDRVPNSVQGRSFAIIWFMAGAVLTSLVVSSITSSLSVSIIDDKLHVTEGKMISSVARYPDYEIMRSLGGSGPAFGSTDELVKALKSGETDGIVVDLYTAGFRKDLFNGSWFTVSKVIPYGFTCGVILGAKATRLEKLFREYARTSGDTSAIRAIQETQEEQEKEQFRDVTKEEDSGMDLIDPTMPIYQLTVAALVVLAIVISLVGSLYHNWYRRRKGVYKLPKLRDCYNYNQTPREEMREMLEEFYKRYSATYAELRRKHRKELRALAKYSAVKKVPLIWV